MFGVSGGQSIGWVDKGYKMGERVWPDLEFILCDTVYHGEFQAYWNTTRLFMEHKSVEDALVRQWRLC